MPTQTPLTDAINALTTYANTVTSASDTTLSDAVATLAAGYGGGGGGNEDAILERTLISLTNNSITTLGNGALYDYSSLTSVTFGSVTTVEANAMAYCSGITSLSDANFPSLTRVKDSSFAYMTGLQTINLTSTIDIASNAYTFRGCTSLTSAMLPNLETSPNNSATTRSFYGCTALEVCDLGNVKGVGIDTFNGCNALRTLILRRTSVMTLNGWAARHMGGIFNNPSESTIYVPQSLITSYQQTGNWASAYSAGVTFAKIEGSIYEL